MANVTVADLSTWLSSQDANTPDTAYEINLTDVTSSNISSIKTSLQANPTKYVDLSPTYITNYPISLGGMFRDCTTLVAQPSFSIPSGVNISMYQMFRGCTNLREGIVYSTTRNAEEAFKGCTSLTSITFTSTLQNMESMLDGCISLQSVPVFSGYYSNINMDYTFKDCVSLVGIPNIQNTVTSMVGTFMGCSSLTDVPSIPYGVTSLEGTFSGCSSLVNAPSIPNTVTNMYETFKDCVSLSAPPTIYYTVSDMRYTFQNCVSMASAPTIPDSVTFISNCFENCPFETVDAIPSSITEAIEAFKGCSNLKSIRYFGITLSTLRDNVSFKDMFSGCDSLESIGFTLGRADDWHFYFLKINYASFDYTVVDKDKTRHTDTEYFTKTTLVLPELTDELWFTPSNLSDQDILDIIDNVIDYKLSYFNKDVVDPTKKRFILLSDNPDDTITNLELGGGEDSPLGSIQAYYGTTDPADKRWLICDGRDTTGTDIELETHYPSLYTFLGGTNVLPDLREVTLVGAGQNGTDTIATHDVYNVGQFKDDQIQNITGSIVSTGYAFGSAAENKVTNIGALGSGNFTLKTDSGDSSSSNYIGEINFDASRVARAGTTTHGKQKGVNYIIKAVASTDTYEPPSTEIQEIEQYVDEGLTTVRNEFNTTINTKIGKVANYSTTETPTGGTWIDGKPIYRKVIQFNSETTIDDGGTNFTLASLGLSNIDNIFSVYAFNTTGSKTTKRRFTYVSLYWINDTTLQFRAASGIVSYYLGLVIEYTKTTD